MIYGVLCTRDLGVTGVQKQKQKQKRELRVTLSALVQKRHDGFGREEEERGGGDGWSFFDCDFIRWDEVSGENWFRWLNLMIAFIRSVPLEMAPCIR